MSRTNKYAYIYVLQGNYGYGDGWEDLTAEESYREIRNRLKEYRENEGGNYRIIQRRELNRESGCTCENYEPTMPHEYTCALNINQAIAKAEASAQ